MFRFNFSIKDKSGQVRTRFAPSPTGVLHIGGARTALFNYLFARQNNGKFILRIEDTDRKRSKKEYEEDIIESLKWLGINWDEFYRQSERAEIYKNYLKRLLAEEKVYLEAEAIRFKNPNKKIVFEDLIRGEIAMETSDLGDFVIAKNLESPLYHFAVVIDDFEMRITHIIRGEDHISNTPRQILIQEALGFSRPFYAHLPLILGPDKSKLSKRHGAVSVNEYKNLGYLPEAMINFIAFLGWNPGGEREIFSMEELIKEFSLRRIQKAGAIFNIERLEWLNKEYLKKIDSSKLDDLITRYVPENLQNIILWRKIIKLLIDDKRISKMSDINNLWNRGELNYFFKEPDYDIPMLNWQDEKIKNTKTHLGKLVKILCDIQEHEFTKENIKNAVWHYAEKSGRGNVLWPFRVALTGLKKSPDPFVISEILGKDETIKRLHNAIKKI